MSVPMSTAAANSAIVILLVLMQCQSLMGKPAARETFSASSSSAGETEGPRASLVDLIHSVLATTSTKNANVTRQVIRASDLTGRTRRSAEVTGNSRSRIFSARLGSDPWARHLGNPCHSSGGSATSAADVLGVSGREAAVSAFAGNTLSTLRQLTAALPSTTECPDFELGSLPPMPNLSGGAFTTEQLTALYRSFHSLAAHFHFMKRDWQHGRSCTTHPERIIRHADRLSAKFRRGMCVLMRPNTSGEPNAAAPFPSADLLAAHATALEQELYHYYDCTGRAARDCIVAGHAQSLLNAVAAAAANATSSGI